MKSLFITFILLINISVFAQDSIWDNLLKKHVDEHGWVNYDGFKKDKQQLDTYIHYLENTIPTDSWSDNKTKAFWINAYNAYTIKTILDHAPVKSILDIKEDDKNAWEISFAKVGGKTYTLNHIEHEILRKEYDDPRVHVGVNCASISCPALPNKAFTENNIDALLTSGMKSFVNDEIRNSLSSKKIKLSQIFNWFQDDFTRQSDLITFINQYSDININNDAKIVYKKYNWNLNNQK